MLTSPVLVDTSAGNQNIVFQKAGTIDGAFGLTLTSGTGAIAIAGAVGGTTPLASLTATGGTITLSGNVTTTGPQIYTDTALDLNGASYKTTVSGTFTENGATVLTGPVLVDTSAGNQNIVFQTPGTIDGAPISPAVAPGAFGLTLTSGTGAIMIAGAVGGTTPLASLTATGGTITLGGNVTTTGPQSYTDTTLDLNGTAYTTTSGAFTENGATVLTSPVLVDTSAGNQNIVFQKAGTIDGAFGLTLTSGTGAIAIAGAVGGTTPLASLTATGGTITLSGNVTTTGPQIYTDAALDLNGASYKTTVGGTFTENGATVLTGPVLVDTSAGNQNIVFQTPGTIDGAPISPAVAPGAFGLTLTSGTGAIMIAGAVGGTTPLASLTATGGTITLGGNVTTTGPQSYTDTILDLNGTAYTTTSGAFTENGATVLTSPVLVDTSAGNQNIVFQKAGTIDGAFGLTLTSGTGAIAIAGAVGGTTPLASLTATGGTITLSGNVTTTGPQIYTDTALDLNGASYKTTVSGTFTENGATVLTGPVLVDTSAGNQNIVFQAPGTIDGAFGLTLNSGTGAITIAGAVGGTTPLASLMATGGTIMLDGNVTTTGPQSYTDTTLDLNGASYKTTVSGTFTENGATVLTGPVLVDTSAGNQNIVFQAPGTIDGAFGLTLDSGTGAVTIAGAVGGTTPLTSLTATGGTIMLDGNVTTTGPLTLTQMSPGVTLTLAHNLITSQTVTLTSAGTITQTEPITAQNLVARTQSDAGAALTLTNSANDVPGNVTLSALNSVGTAPAAGNIDFVDRTGFTLAAQTANGLHGQEIGVNTTADVTMRAGGDFLSTGGGLSTLTVGGMISSGGVIALAAGRGGISISGSIAGAGGAASTSTGLGLFSTGPIIENATGTISVPYLVALTENDTGAPITLTAAGNRVDAVTLSTLNGLGNPAGPIAAPGKISFADSKGFQILPVMGIENFNGDLKVLDLTPAQVSALTAQAFGINTSGDAVLSAVSATSASITTNAGGRIAATDLVVRNQSDLGQEINLTSSQNTVPGKVTLSALNTAGNAPASGAIGFVDSTGFTVAAQPGNGLNGQEIGVNTASDINLMTLNSGANLTLGGKLSAPGHMVTLTSAATITEQPGVAITAGTLTGSSAGNASFAQGGNMVANLGAFTTTAGGNNGDFTLTNGQALNTVGLVNTGTGVVTLSTAGTLTEQSGGGITAGTLTGSSVGGASLMQGNSVGTFGPFSNTTSGLLSFTDAQPFDDGGCG